MVRLITALALSLTCACDEEGARPADSSTRDAGATDGRVDTSREAGDDEDVSWQVSRAWGPCEVSHVFSAQGERLAEWTWLYDADGREFEVRSDGPIAGEPFRSRESVEFHEETGAIILRETWRDTAEDATPDSYRVIEYTDLGQARHERNDVAADGTVDWQRLRTYVDDRLHTIEIDEAGDGEYEWLWTQTYDEQGREQSLVARTPNGEVPYNWTVYDDAGRLIRREWDSDLDGIADAIDEYDYRDDGSILSLREGLLGRFRFFDRDGTVLDLFEDYDSDGFYDRHSSYMSLPSGDVAYVADRTSRLDNEVYDNARYFVRDDQGVLQRIEIDYDGDDDADAIEEIETHSDCCSDGECYLR